MQENFFFREPETQRMMLDILFIYSKLNPDIGYRQGMHELLAPLLWVVQQDALKPASLTGADKDIEGFELMQDILDYSHREADAFSLLCAVMQTTKSFYEMGDNRDSSPIVAKSRRIHDDLLGIFDSELALHLQVAGVLPQIYAIRWIRLLFGREFDFKDLLKIWDILFAENLRSDIIDLTCVAMLLRIRWTLVEADYSTAITTLTHVKVLGSDEDPRGLVRDAMVLDKSRTAETGILLIQKASGRKPKVQNTDRTHLSLDQSTERRGSRTSQYRPSPTLSPARLTGPQRQLESLFNDVSGGIRSRTEGWNVSKAVRGAVSEVRRNMAAQASHSRQSSVDFVGHDTPRQTEESDTKEVHHQLRRMEERNKALAKMLDAALESLRASRAGSEQSAQATEESFNISLAKIQFVSVYLADPAIPIPTDEFRGAGQKQISEPLPLQKEASTTTSAVIEPKPVTTKATASPRPTKSPSLQPTPARQLSPSPQLGDGAKNLTPITSTPPQQPVRPSLADSSFSFMLGENRHRSSFVSSAAAPPEERRGSAAADDKVPKSKGLDKAPWSLKNEERLRRGSKEKGPTLSGANKGKGASRDAEAEEEEGWTMTNLTGGSGPL